jgi:hypothetical protein
VVWTGVGIRSRRRLASSGARSRGGCASGGQRVMGVVRVALAATCGEKIEWRRPGCSGERRDRRLGERARGTTWATGPRRGKGCAKIKIYGSGWVKCFYGLHYEGTFG